MTIKVCLCDLVKWLVVRVSTGNGSGSEKRPFRMLYRYDSLRISLLFLRLGTPYALSRAL